MQRKIGKKEFRMPYEPSLRALRQWRDLDRRRDYLIAKASSEGATEGQIARASGLSMTSVRRVLRGRHFGNRN